LRGIFDLKKYFAEAILDLFSFFKKGFLNSQAVRIRVKSYKESEKNTLLYFNYGEYEIS
jgi:hypothetical protein